MSNFRSNPKSHRARNLFIWFLLLIPLSLVGSYYVYPQISQLQPTISSWFGGAGTVPGEVETAAIPSSASVIGSDLTGNLPTSVVATPWVGQAPANSLAPGFPVSNQKPPATSQSGSTGQPANSKTTPAATTGGNNGQPTISKIAPTSPGCLSRNATNLAERTLLIEGNNLKKSSYNLEFQKSIGSISNLYIRGEVNWESSQRISLDFQRVTHLLFPNEFRLRLQVRLVESFANGSSYTYKPVTDWSPEFMLVSDKSWCAARLADQPPRRTVNVYILNFDPIIEGQVLHKYLKMNDPAQLNTGFIKDIAEISGGTINIKIVHQTTVDAYPPRINGVFMSKPQILDCVKSKGTSDKLCWGPLDYKATLQTVYDSSFGSICSALASKKIDEVWLWGGPWAAFQEFIFADLTRECGLPQQATPRAFPVMGFNYERTNAEMLHSFGHRSEDRLTTNLGMTTWNKFDGNWGRINMGDVNRAVTHCGNVHFPPNANKDYLYNRNLPVVSDCEDWKNYPNMTGQKRTINYTDWCGADGDCQRGFLKWWFGNMPRKTGSYNDIYLNWWHYIFPVETTYVR